MPDQETHESLSVAFVDQSFDANTNARDNAEKRLTEELNSGNHFQRFVKGIWKGNLARDYYRAKYIQQERQTIEESGDIYEGRGGDVDAHEAARRATIDRFTSEYESTLHTEAGEQRAELGADSDLVLETKSLIKRYAEGELNDQTLREERTRLLQAFADAGHQDLLGEGRVRVDNILEVAQATRGAVDHGASLDHVLEKMRFVTGETRSGVRTEAHLNKIDKIAEKLGSTRLGSLVNETTIISAVSIAASVARFGSHSALGAVTKTLAPGIGAGVWAASRENRRVKDERAEHAREMAQGETYEEGSKRRDQMEATRYETARATDLADELREHYAEDHDLSGQDAYEAALASLAAVNARVGLSDRKSVDLISYSDTLKVDEERMVLDVARAELKVALSHGLTPELQKGLGFEESQSFHDIITARTEATIDLLASDMLEKDRAFKKLRNKRVLAAGAVGTVVGLVAGTLVQEGIAAVDPTRVGLVDIWTHNTHTELVGGEQHQTLIAGFINGDHTTIHHAASEQFSDPTHFGQNGSMEITKDAHIVTNPNHTISVIDGAGHTTVSDVPVESDGTLSATSQALLEHHGLHVEDLTHTVDVTHTETVQEGVDQWVGDSHDTTTVTRDLWYDNDTPNVYDHNELGLHWGGEGGLDGQGGYDMSVATMTEDGSYHDNLSADWLQQAQEGNLKLAISASVGTQDHVFMVPIDANGNAHIDPGSPAAHFFTNENGHAVFTGQYAEAVQTTGADGSGVTHMRPLATFVGNNQTQSISVEHTIVDHVKHPEYKITTSGYDTVQENYTEMAPVIPVESRRPLENLRRPGVTTSEAPAEVPRTPEQAAEYYGRGDWEPTEGQRVEEFAPGIAENPGADLELGRELDWFAGDLRAREGDSYMDKLEETINGSVELRSMNPAIKTITTIPVAAASESDNIYNSLSLYAQQDKEQLDHNTILLNVNWLDVAQNDPEKRTKINKTFAEIERARHDFPELKIATMTRQYNAERVEATQGVIGYVASDLMNTALYALHRGIQNGTIPKTSDVVIIRQDADMKGMSRHYLAHLEKSMERNPRVDLFNGIIRSDVGLHGRYPGFGIVTNFSQALRVAETSENKIHTVGINLVARAATLAAVGGLGRLSWTGPGSDDMQVGWRIGGARQGAKIDRTAGYVSPEMAAGRSDRRIVAQVAGMTVDSAADRLLPQYLRGRHFGAAWNSGVANDGTAFEDGPGGYRDRDADAQILVDNSKERIRDGKIFSFIEENLAAELRQVDIATGRKALAVFFGSVPGAYRVRGIGTDYTTFKLTPAGRAFLKKRIQRESNGMFGSYGLRKMRQLYGISGKRQPVHAESPLVAPLT